MRRISLVALAMMFAIGFSVRAEQIENPSYKNWAKFKPGSSHTMKGTTTAMGQNIDTEVVTVLKEVTDDKVVLEIAATVNMGGNAMPQPKQTQEVKKMVEKGDPNVTDPDAYAKATEEDVKIGDTTYKCKLVETTKTQGGTTMKMKAWMCEEVPGGVVKLDGKGEGEMAISMNMQMTACEKK